MLEPFAPSDDVELICELASRELPEGQALHGDAHLFNCIQTAAGPIWHDLETACRGPREYDLAALVLDDRSNDSDPEARSALAAYGSYDEELLERALPVYGAWIAASFMAAIPRRPDAAPHSNASCSSCDASATRSPSATAILLPVVQEGLARLESLGAIAAEPGRRLRKVDQVRAHVHRELGGAEIEQELSGHGVFVRRPALGVRLQRLLDALQALDVGERSGNRATLCSPDRARRRASRRADRRSRWRMPAAAVATGRHQREYRDRGRANGRRYAESRHPDRG